MTLLLTVVGGVGTVLNVEAGCVLRLVRLAFTGGWLAVAVGGVWTVSVVAMATSPDLVARGTAMFVLGVSRSGCG